jgi:ankyrin repeat protein
MIRARLIRAARQGHVAVVSALLQRAVADGGAQPDGTTACWSAAGNGHDDCVDQLLAAGASPRALVNGVSMLFLAAQNGHADVVARLLATGRGLLLGVSDTEYPPLWAACRGGECSAECRFSRGAAG